MVEESQILTGVALGTRGGAQEGSLALSSNGLTFKKAGGALSPRRAGRFDRLDRLDRLDRFDRSSHALRLVPLAGGRTVEIKKADIASMMWSESSRLDTGSSGTKMSVLRVILKKKNGSHNFVGFPKSKLAALSSTGLGEAKEVALSTKGHNWGNMSFDESVLVFKDGDKVAFTVPLSEVQQATLGRDEVMMQLPIDDTVERADDALVGISFHIPKDAEDFPDAAEELPASKALYDMLKPYTLDTGAGDVVASFDQVGVLVPRGRFDIEMYTSSFHLLGQAHDFRVQYSSIMRIFVLPKTNSSQTVVAVALDPPLRKGQTTYGTVLCQFPNEEQVTVELQLNDEQLAKLNDKGAKLSKTMSGSSPDIFAKALRGLSGAKLTRTGAFRDSIGEEHAVRCTYKNDDGYLYPLEKAFFYLVKPPTLIPYDDIRSVEFMRQSGASASKTFDLTLKMKGSADDYREQSYLFRSIPRAEWTNLFEWIKAKNLRVENLKEVQEGPVARPGFGDMVGIDPALAAIDAAGSDDDGFEEEDEDFEASESESDGDDSDVEGAAETVPLAKKKEKKKKEPSQVKSPKSPKSPASQGDKDGKKKRKKKDPNAPKKNLTAFFFFSNEKRAAVTAELKAANPDMKGVAEIGKRLGEMWKELSDADKEPYAKQAEEDKARYLKEMENYTPPEDDGEDEPAAKKGKKAKAKKDPNAPKKNLTAFFFFSNSKRAEVTAELKAANPDMKGVAEVGRKLGELWKAMSDADKEPFNAQAVADKERYEEEMERYKAKQAADGGEGEEGTEEATQAGDDE